MATKRKRDDENNINEGESEDEDTKINNKNNTSQVKNNFEIKIVDGAKVGVCKLCKTVTKTIKMTNSNTTGLKRHLQRNHAKVYETIFGISKSPGVSSKQTYIHDMFKQTTPSVTNQDLDRKIVKWMAIKYLPFNFFDDEETQEFFSILNPKINMPKRTAMRAKVVQVFTEIQKSVIDILKQNKSKISFTLDGWTSIAGKSYYGITAHFINDDWKLISIALDFVASNGHHTGKDIAEIFFTSLKDKGILEKVLGITLDNAASNTTFIAEFEKLMKNNSLDFDRENQHFLVLRTL